MSTRHRLRCRAFGSALGGARALLTLALVFGPNLSCNVGSLVGGGCVKRLSACAGECVNVGSDPLNCGFCGNECPSDTECKAGACVRGSNVLPLVPRAVDAGPRAASPHAEANADAGCYGVDAGAGRAVRDGGACSLDAAGSSSTP